MYHACVTSLKEHKGGSTKTFSPWWSQFLWAIHLVTVANTWWKNISKSIVLSLLPLLAFFYYYLFCISHFLHPSFYFSIFFKFQQQFLLILHSTFSKAKRENMERKMSNTIAALHLDPQLRLEGIKKNRKREQKGFWFVLLLV